MYVVEIVKCQLHVAEAAALLGCSSMKVYALINSKKLPAHKEGKAWKIRVDDLKVYLDSFSQQKH